MILSEAPAIRDGWHAPSRRFDLGRAPLCAPALLITGLTPATVDVGVQNDHPGAEGVLCGSGLLPCWIPLCSLIGIQRVHHNGHYRVQLLANVI